MNLLASYSQERFLVRSLVEGLTDAVHVAILFQNSYTLPACHVTFGHVPFVDQRCLSALHHVLLQSWSVASGLLVACLSLSYPQL